jgi:hypothetical protein
MTFETGDIVLIKVNNFSTWYRRLLGKLIQFFEGVYHHHAGTIADGLIYEADTRVIRRDPGSRLAGDEIIVFRLKEPLEEREKYLYEKLAQQTLNRKYDYWGTLLHHLIYILTFRRLWIGKTGESAMMRPYCTELSVHMIHKIRGYFAQPWKTGPKALLQQAPMYYDVVFQGLYQPGKQ